MQMFLCMDFLLKTINVLRRLRLIMRSGRRDHMTPVLRKLHRVPFKLRVNYKVRMYAYKVIHTMAPSYLNCSINVSKPVRTTRSSTQFLLVVPNIAEQIR